MRYVTFTLVLFICCIAANAQKTPLTDSLKLQLKNSKSNEQKVFWLGQLAQWYSSIDTNEAKTYSNKQLRLAETAINSKSRFTAYNDHTFFYLTKGNKGLDSATYFANKGISLGKQEKNNEYKAWGTLQLSIIEYYKGQLETALKYINEASRIATTVASDSLH
jgi:hypothetical protein